ncbi:hypothetical protein [Candidatus Marithrix sp. Canyon 246]|nr:hypothetical protein [Candidatus Marithrix sp. Canyon 246]
MQIIIIIISNKYNKIISIASLTPFGENQEDSIKVGRVNESSKAINFKYQ